MRRRTRLAVMVGFLLLCTAATALNAVAQRVPTDTNKPLTSTPKPNRPRHPRTPRTNVSTRNVASPTVVESDNFLNLGDSFREKEKWNATEAAYKEAVKLWPGNADALLELGYLHVDRNKLQEAQVVYSKLRGVNSSYAAELLAEINKRKAQR
jgi:tetratricopeptide (TPR) repeat protein